MDLLNVPRCLYTWCCLTMPAYAGWVWFAIDCDPLYWSEILLCRNVTGRHLALAISNPASVLLKTAEQGESCNDSIAQIRASAWSRGDVRQQTATNFSLWCVCIRQAVGVLSAVCSCKFALREHGDRPDMDVWSDHLLSSVFGPFGWPSMWVGPIPNNSSELGRCFPIIKTDKFSARTRWIC